MTLKMIGAAFVIAACGGFGFSLAAAHKKEENALKSLLRAIEFMICDLEFQNTPLPELCRRAGNESGDIVGSLFLRLASTLDRKQQPDAPTCMRSLLQNDHQIPTRTHRNLLYLGQCMGRFALSGQVSGFRSAQAMCQRDLASLSTDRDARLRSYRTLGICGGIALVILFI